MLATLQKKLLQPARNIHHAMVYYSCLISHTDKLDLHMKWIAVLLSLHTKETLFRVWPGRMYLNYILAISRRAEKKLPNTTFTVIKLLFF